MCERIQNSDNELGFIDDNRKVYENIDIVEHYIHASGLQPAEKYIFEKYIKPDIAILDLGCGGGRTTPFLMAENRRYVGVDYSTAMILACQKKFPNLPFYAQDACDLSFFRSGTFDSIVFSFNGIDYLFPDSRRRKCLREINRLLLTNGLFIFSVHNPRVLFVCPQLHSANLSRRAWRLIRSFVMSIALISNQIRSKAFLD